MLSVPQPAAPRLLARALEGAFALAVAMLFFGDYLALSVSRVLTSSSGNWILFTAVVQTAALVLVVMLGGLRGPAIGFQLGCFATLGALMLLHVIDRQLAGRALGDYGTDKLLSYFGLCGPSLLLGLAIGRRLTLPGSRWVYAIIGPLLCMSLIAMMTDPTLLTIAYFNKPAVFLGVLVLPAHQALAYCLAKGGLFVHAQACDRDARRGRRVLRLAFVGALAGFTLLSGARGYSVALFAALAVQWSFGRRHIGWTLVALLFGAFVIQAFWSDPVADRFDVGEIGMSLAYLERQDVWRSASNAFAESPIFGFGPGGFATYFRETGRVYPHNLGLEIASEFGIAGLACIVAMIGSVCVQIVRLWRSRVQPDGVQMFSIGFLVFALVGAMSVGDLIRNHFLFLALGMAAAATRPGASAAVAPRAVPAPPATWEPAT